MERARKHHGDLFWYVLIRTAGPCGNRYVYVVYVPANKEAAIGNGRNSLSTVRSYSSFLLTSIGAYAGTLNYGWCYWRLWCCTFLHTSRCWQESKNWPPITDPVLMTVEAVLIVIALRLILGVFCLIQMFSFDPQDQPEVSRPDTSDYRQLVFAPSSQLTIILFVRHWYSVRRRRSGTLAGSELALPERRLLAAV